MLPRSIRGARVALCAALLMLLVACDTAPALPTAVPTAAPAATATGIESPPTVADLLPPTKAVPVATDTALPPPPTDTVPPPTDPVPPTDTPVPPTATPLPPTATPTPAGKPRVAGDLSEVLHGPRGNNRIAITFDAGAGRGYVPAILDALNARHLHITFFLTGQWSEQNPDMVKAIVAAGNELGNHTYSHPSFLHITDAQMINEITRTQTILQNMVGVDTRPYWRAPFGDYNGHVLDVVGSIGYRSIFWTWDSLNSVGQPKSKDFLVKRVLNPSVPLDGAIILMHVGNETSAEALPDILDGLAAKGYHVGTITDLLSP